MDSLSKLVIVILLALVLGACATTPKLEEPPLADVEDRVIIDGEALPYPDDARNSELVARSLFGRPRMSPVAQRLLNQAISKQANNDLDGASADIERALRIETRNALLWSRLAHIRFAQDNWKGSVQVAAKSNSLIRQDQSLRRQNWVLMANAYQALGDKEKAEQYREKLQR